MRKFISTGYSLLSNASRPLLSRLKSRSTRSHRTEDEAQPLGRGEVLSLCDLSPDILLLILGFLDARTLLIFKGVSRLLRSLIGTDMLLTYRIEMAINGMIDGPSPSSLTISERLNKLRQYSQRYCTGQFTLDTEMKLGRTALGDMAHFMTPWDYRPTQTNSSPGTVCFELVAGDERSLVVYAPPSIIGDTPSHHWTIPLPPTGKRILAVDITQDLVVSLTPIPGNPGKAEFSLTTLESCGSAVHPLAEEPTWEIPFDGRPSFEGAATQIFGPYIAWQMPYDDNSIFEDRLQVRNWKTGCKVWEDRMRGVSSYTFLNASYIIVVFCTAIDSFPAGPKRRPNTIGIYRIQEERHLPVGHVATLQLPPGLELSAMLNSSVPCPLTPPPSAAFWPDPERRVVVLRLFSLRSPIHALVRALQSHFHNTSSWTWHYSLLVIPCTTFYEQIKLASSTQGSTPVPPISWEDWGLRGSVLIRQDNFENTQRTRHWLPPFVFPLGSRLTFLVPSPDHSGGDPRLVTLDVNPLSKLHPPHPGCTRRGALVSAEKSSDRGLSSILKTTHPRTYYFGPSFTDFEQAFAISQSASGYVVFRRVGRNLEGFSAFSIL